MMYLIKSNQLLSGNTVHRKKETETDRSTQTQTQKHKNYSTLYTQTKMIMIN